MGGFISAVAPVLKFVSTAFSIGSAVQGLSGGGDRAPNFQAPAAPAPVDIPEIPIAPGRSGGVDTIAQGLSRRRRVEQIQSRGGAQSTVLSSVGTGGSLGAG